MVVTSSDRRYPAAMWYPVNYGRVILLQVILLIACNARAQDLSLKGPASPVLDSLDNRIEELQQQIPRLKESRGLSYYNLQRELDLTLFARAYEEYVLEEELDAAADLIEKRIDRATLKSDQYSLQVYKTYKEKVNEQLKRQRIYYQQLFEKPNRIRLLYEEYTREGTPESYCNADHKLGLALKYAAENNFTEAAASIRRFKSMNEALVYDAGSPYELAELTRSSRDFEKQFKPLFESESLQQIIMAEDLVTQCLNYARLAQTGLDSTYFSQLLIAVSNAMSDKAKKEENSVALQHFDDKSLAARFDTLNPCGVYKWQDQVVVIDEFVSSSTFDNVKQGEAILHADKVLANYLKDNKLCKSTQDLTFGYAYIIPYRSAARNTSFCYNAETRKWQYIACYTLINDEAYTREVIMFMPAVIFSGDGETVGHF